MPARPRTWVVCLLSLLTLAAPLAAQTGTISGTVTEANGGRPIAGVNVVVYLAGIDLSTARAVTAPNGTYRITGLAAGNYRVRTSLIGYGPETRDPVAVGAGAIATVDFSLSPQATVLQEVEVSAVSRRVEKAIDAPASVHVIQATELAERPAITVMDHLKGVPGVDVSQGGLVQSNVVVRGFNNIFSGGLLMLTDHRFAAVPSLRVNVPAFFPGTGEDLERLEVVLGPGAALYGPYASGGVLNMVTKSPLDYRGTTLVLEGGLRSATPYVSAVDGGGNRAYQRYDDAGSLYRLSGRHAGLVGEKFGYKLSGEYFTGDDWQFVDQGESARAAAEGCGVTCRDYKIERYSFDLRTDYRPNINTSIVANYGYTNAKNLIELTGLGAGQAQGWVYQYAQARVTHKQFFAQAFGNFSDAGETFLLRSGLPLFDGSRLWAVQAQQGFQIGNRQSFLAGVDYILTDSRTNGTINGVYEDDDTMREWGGYIHSVTSIGSKLELTTALRADDHSRVKDIQVSPRVALVFSPSDNHSLRLTYNRAHSNPSSLNLFLDIVGGGAGPYTVRALGVPDDGFSFRGGSCAAGGVDNLCMRSPFPGANALGLIPANAASLWSVAIGALQQGGAINAQTAGFLNANAPTPAQVGTQLRVLNTTSLTFNNIEATSVKDIGQIQPTITRALELGYKGILGGAARLSIDFWYENKRDFVGPLIVESPNVFLNTAQTIAWLTPLMTAALGSAGGGAAAAGQLGTAMGGISGATSASRAQGVPLGTVVPHNAAATQRADIFLTYRNFGEVDLFGTDMALDVVVSPRFTLAGTVSFTNKDYYTRDDVRREGEVTGFADVTLNAPKAKGSVAIRYRDEHSGLSGETRFRAVKGFPISSGVFSSGLLQDGITPKSIANYSVMDAQLAYRLPVGARSATLALIATNLFNTPYATFVGVPSLGRTVISKISYTF